MEKIFRCSLFFVCLLFIPCGNVFPESDISLDVSLSFSHTDYFYRNRFYHSAKSADFKFGVTNYNFPFEKSFSGKSQGNGNIALGFFEGISFGFSDGFSAGLFFGPALRLPFSEWLCVQGGTAFLFSAENKNLSGSGIFQLGFGLLNEIRFKFFPEKRLSLCAGFDFSLRFVCYQIEDSPLYRAYWWLENFSSFDLNPFVSVSFKV